MLADALNPIIAKKVWKRIRRYKERLYIFKNYYKLQIIANEGEIIELKKGST